MWTSFNHEDKRISKEKDSYYVLPSANMRKAWCKTKKCFVGSIFVRIHRPLSHGWHLRAFKGELYHLTYIAYLINIFRGFTEQAFHEFLD